MCVKNCGLYIRVSTDRQARVEEGSLKNQEQRLRQFIDMKNSSEEKWLIVDSYIDKGRSAKDTKRTEYQRMLHDITCQRIDAVICTALSRISRSVRDSLDMVEWFEKQGVDFICLKENFDTSTAQGKCFFTIMGALNQFEREQTSERTRYHMIARGERGLSQGCYILGYDIDRDKPGNLLPNKTEAQIVNFAFDTYLETGSILKTAQTMNGRGHLSKEYTTKAGKSHKPKPLCYSAVRNILSNYAYVGERELFKKNKDKAPESVPEDKRYRRCKAVWEPIIDRSKFEDVQKLLKENLKHKNNGAKPTRHSYLFNGQYLICHKCGSRMEGRNGHGRSKKVYYYYSCVNTSCRLKVPEKELENVVQKLVGTLASEPLMIERITDRVNNLLRRRLPVLRGRKSLLGEELDGISTEAKDVMDRFLKVKNGRIFVEERLEKLEERRKRMLDEVESLDGEISALEKEAISEDKVKRLLFSFGEIFRNHIKPYEKKILLRWLLVNIKVGLNRLKVGIDSGRFRSDITQLLRSDVIPDINGGS